jgi:hypothetical protein
MCTDFSYVTTAATLARDLAARDIDPNAVAQACTYLRVLLNRAGTSEREQQQALRTWWRWLDMVSGRGADAVVRSNRTVRYFQTTRSVCQTHLSKLQPQTALKTLAWAIRLLRYYQSDPHSPTWFGDTLPPTTPHPSRPKQREPEPPPPPPPPPVTPTLPQVGEVFTGTILEDDGEQVAIEVPNFTYKQALARVAPGVRGTRSYREGNTARVEVLSVRTLKSGKTILDVKPVQAAGQAAKKKKKGK